VIATRGGLAAPEAPFVIEHREALIYMLCEAAELEHGIMCQHLFAAFSLKQSAAEGLTADLATVTRWRGRIAPPEREIEVPPISDPLTAKVVDLFNVSYEVLLQMFDRYFAHTEETDAQLKTLADAALGLMLRVLKPLGDLITTLPAGPGLPGRTAGPSFELFYESDYLMPHREAAWALLTERLGEASWLCQTLQGDHGTNTGDRLEQC
jgi:hypothetical protein